MSGGRLALCFAVASLFFVSSPAAAHGAMHRLENACVVKIGPDFMYFSGYQPAASRKKFCEDVPATGDAIYALDYAQSEMRDMTADLRIVRDAGETEPTDLRALTVAYLPPKIYPNGTLGLEHVFSERGDFVGIVAVDGPHGEHWVARFPFSVGRLYSPRAPYYLLATAAALALLALLWRKEEPAR